jgi:transposase
MANRLTMARVQAILSLHERGWPQRRIARELDVDRETVAKYVRAVACDPRPAKAPIGSEVADGQARAAGDRPSPVMASDGE